MTVSMMADSGSWLRATNGSAGACPPLHELAEPDPDAAPGEEDGPPPLDVEAQAAALEDEACDEELPFEVLSAFDDALLRKVPRDGPSVTRAPSQPQNPITISKHATTRMGALQRRG
jgi:hypothetical protein